MELSEVLHIQTSDGASYDFEVVGIVEDPDAEASYAVLRHQGTDNGEEHFIVTDSAGNILQDEDLAQQVLDEFLDFAEEEHGGAEPSGERD